MSWRQTETAYRAYLKSQPKTADDYWHEAERDVARDLRLWRERAIIWLVLITLAASTIYHDWPDRRVAGVRLKQGRIYATSYGCTAQPDGIIVRCDDFYMTLARPLK